MTTQNILDLSKRITPSERADWHKYVNAYIYGFLFSGSVISERLQEISHTFDQTSVEFNPVFLFYDTRLYSTDLTKVKDVIPYSLYHCTENMLIWLASKFFETFELLYTDTTGSIFSTDSPFINTDIGKSTDSGQFTDGFIGVISLIFKIYYDISAQPLYAPVMQNFYDLLAIVKPARLFFFSLPVFTINLQTLADFSQFEILQYEIPPALVSDVGYTTDTAINTDEDFIATALLYTSITINSDSPITVIPTVTGDIVKWSFKYNKNITYLKIEGPSVWLEINILSDTYLTPVYSNNDNLIEIIYFVDK